MAKRNVAVRPPSGWDYVLGGAVVSGIGGLLLVAEDAPHGLSLVLLWIGSVLATVGVVGVGVTVGFVRADWQIRVQKVNDQQP